MKPITSFFSSVSSASHRAQTILEIESTKERKRKREAELENQRKNREQASLADKTSILSASDSVADACRYEIDMILASEDDYILVSSKVVSKYDDSTATKYCTQLDHTKYLLLGD